MNPSWWRVALFMLIALVLDDKLAAHLAIRGVRPDFALLGLFWVTLRYGPNVGIWTGFVAGLFLDVASPETLGARALSLSVAAAVTGRAAEHVDAGSLPVRLLLLAVMGVTDALIFEIASHFTRPGVVASVFFGRDLPDLAYTIGVAVVVLLTLGHMVLPARIGWRGNT